MGNRLGKYTCTFDKKPVIKYTSNTVGSKEGEGPLGKYFDTISDDPYFGEKTWEKAESRMVKDAYFGIMKKSDMSIDEIDYIVAGDLLNQCTGANYAFRDQDASFIGVYGACSTFAESMGIAANLIEAGSAKNVLCATSSHFCSAERQFRFPLELGTQRTPTSHWTVTASGMAIVSEKGQGPVITSLTVGKIVDMGISDVNNMGAAMAPAAASTIKNHLSDTGRDTSYYDLIVTGDLGVIGKHLLLDILHREGITNTSMIDDCGCMIYDIEKQDAHAGGSGCGCSAAVFTAYLYQKLFTKELNRILFVPTGALMSTVSSQQGETIPSIATAICIETE